MKRHSRAALHLCAFLFLPLLVDHSLAQEIESAVCEGEEPYWQMTIGNGSAVLQHSGTDTQSSQYAGGFQRVPTRNRGWLIGNNRGDSGISETRSSLVAIRRNFGKPAD
jgi:hypothetical protein